MLASGVRSSCETLLTSSLFTRSLSRSFRFWSSSSRRPRSSAAAISDDPSRRSRIALHEPDERKREVRHVRVDRALDRLRAALLRRAVGREPEQLAHLARVAGARVAPGLERALVVRDHEAAEPGLQVESQGLEA